ncbi:MAG: tRNA (N6-threonylcarbamoyladenosine(37)-N6)-methyltransferase TrmO [Candidatus Thermoplasmatota archaeon]
MNEIRYTPIGVIHTPFNEQKGTPIQPFAARGAKGTVEVYDGFVEGLADIEGFSHIILLYHCHLSKPWRAKVVPYMDDKPRGVFSTRAPSRPNPIGLSVVRLIKVALPILHVQDVDILNGTPLLDIKPYVPDMDHRAVERLGWLEEKVQKLPKMMADRRFASGDDG